MENMTPHRSYCHPIDASIIRVLDNPAVNFTFRKILTVLCDGTFGKMIANGIPVNERSFPEVYRMVQHCADMLQIPMPYVVISGDVGFNAFTTGSDKEPYIVLGNILVKLMTEQQLHFVIGHECGHIAMGHVLYRSVANAMKIFAANVPVIGDLVNSTAGIALNAWSRRSEITADRAGLICCGDLNVAQSALLKVEMGLLDLGEITPQDYIDSSAKYRSGSFIRRMGEYGEDHPLLAKRIEALELFMNSSLLFRLAGQSAPEEALNDRELERRIEKLLRVR